ncbi:MAG: 16S rRNA (cytosine(1402)-N(4))-methyltransferase RsmH [Clostridia bacterium]|nr:16S rRNA (cytosine(1402)-N(4))-methyltransferase RsmH [Clostridia bacterium]
MTEATSITETPVFSHYSVMRTECIDGLHIAGDGVYVDCTLGGGGHSLEIAKRLTGNGRLICIDQDMTAIRAASKVLAPYSDRITFVHDNFSNIRRILDDCGVDFVMGALIDLGVSSYQLDTPERGFSYQHDAPLDMRMNPENPRSAYDIVNGAPFEELRRIITDYGEERFANSIAKNIVRARETHPIETTFALADIVKSSIPAKNRQEGGHPAKRTFQAIRIAVNDELSIIAPTVKSLIEVLAPGGRLCVLTFHSLEDRIVKQTYQEESRGCTCPPDFPVCVCGKKPKIRILTKKPITASDEELAENNRSHSAKLRICEKLSSV